LPGDELDLNIEDFAKLACTLLDIPVHQSSNNNNEKNLIESLHVFFTLYSEFKAN
jgi:intraflagellar transport protein 46